MMGCIGFPCILLLTLPQHEVLQWSRLTLTQNDITSSATVLQSIGSVVFWDFTVLYNASVLCEILKFSMISYIGFPCVLLLTLPQHEVLQWSRLTLTQNDITSSATVLQAIDSVVLLDFTSYYIRQRAGPLLI